MVVDLEALVIVDSVNLEADIMVLGAKSSCSGHGSERCTDLAIADVGALAGTSVEE